VQAPLETLNLIAEALLPSDGAWRASVAARALELLRAQPDLATSRGQLLLLLRALESPTAMRLLVGQSRGYSQLSATARAEVLRRLRDHPLTAVRAGFVGLKRLLAVTFYADVDAHGSNPTWARLGYPGPIAAAPAVPKPIQPLTVHADTDLECDVVIVGSGAGGGMVAVELAQAGLDVVVLERGPYLNESDFTQRELEMLGAAYLDGGLRTTTDGGMVLLAGACLGGGTVVNYTTSFRTPDAVRTEWAETGGLPLFTIQAFDGALDAACLRLGVNQDHNRPSRRDELMEQGLRTQGWHVDRMPRDVQGCTQDDVCGYCGLGCVRGAKRSSLATCLEEAHARGTRIVVNCKVERVTIANGRAIGVEAHDARSGARLRVRARRTVVAAGALGTPALLLRSGVHGAVGQYLRLHPATAVWGRFDDDVRPWTGTIQALYSDQLADLDAGYGVRFETTAVHPGFLALAAPWETAERFDALMEHLPRTSLVGVLLRDRDPGRVTIGRDGLPRVRYQISAYDQTHIRRGVVDGARVLAAAGARRVFATQTRDHEWRPDAEPLEVWTELVDRVGYGANRTLYVSFHQMGTCRMGGRRRDSVVDGDGASWDVRDLHVADASLFPSASGVNPMVTIAALAYHVAQALKSRL
jgi:long-chain-alcohol oxidase